MERNEAIVRGLPIGRRVIDFMSLRPGAVLLSILLMTTALFFTWSRGVNYGIDFLGGLKLTYQFSETTEPVTDGGIKRVLDASEIPAQVQRFGGEHEAQRFLVKVRQPEESADAITQSITAALTKAFGAGTLLEGEESVGPRVGQELRVKGQKTIIYILFALLLYIGFRFDFLFAPGAIVALVHDVVITIGVLVLLGVEFNLTILAALLTIAGYSINDTIIIYDRIREHNRDINPKSVIEVVNQSLTETIPRTIVTSITTLIAVGVLFAIAGGDIKDFALTFMIGIIVGTYSSIFVASPVYILAFRRWPPR
jgi:preprotein translocase subunit SecF